MPSLRLLLTLVLVTIPVPVFAQSNDLLPRFEPAPCPKLEGAEALADATCGYLVVPENRSRPLWPHHSAHGCEIPGTLTGETARSCDLSGRRAGRHRASGGQRAYRCADFIRDRDILVVSQRGTMFSQPALTCESIDDFARVALGLRFYSEATKRAHLAATEACHRKLAATGADLSAYNSTESAADFADLRKVLGYTAWNVYGTSYGSYLAQTLMRDHPDGIRSVVLDSVLPTNYSVPANWWNARAGFDNFFQACAAEMACNAAHPRLQETFTRLVNKLEAEPLTTTVSDPATGEDLEVMLDGGALVDWLRNQNYAVSSLRAAPNRLDGLAAGRPEAIAAIAKDRASRAPPSGPDVPALGYGLALGVSCREDYPFATPDELAAAGREAFPDYPASVTREGIGGWAYFNEDCRDVWRVPAAPERHAPAGRKRHPDAPHLRQLRYADVACRGEGRSGGSYPAQPSSASRASGISCRPNSPCAQRVIVSFLADPAAPDASCVAGLTPQTFAAPESP